MKRQLNFKLILPKTIDNTYSGNRIPMVFFYFIILFTIVRSLIHILSPDGGSMSIATIPLNTYSSAAANTVVYMFGVWGLSQLMMGIIYLIVGIKYKSLIPLMYIFITCEYGIRIIIGHMKPIVTMHTAPGTVGNYILVPLGIILFLLSILNNRTSSTIGTKSKSHNK
jgi:hypothetical protein